MADGRSFPLPSVLRFARDVPPAILEAICCRLEALPAVASAEERAQIALAIPNAEVRHAFSKLVAESSAPAPEISSERLAWFLRGASAMDQSRRSQESIELVWTGPAAGGVPTRRTDQVLLDMIHEAQREILIVAYAAYKLPELAKALVDAAGRGVRILLVLESSEEGKIGFGALEGFGKKLAESAELYTWPVEKRLKDQRGNSGSLHAKCAVADGRSLLISSANLTQYAMNLNIEAGVLVRGGSMPAAVRKLFEGLIASEMTRFRGSVGAAG